MNSFISPSSRTQIVTLFYNNISQIWVVLGTNTEDEKKDTDFMQELYYLQLQSSVNVYLIVYLCSSLFYNYYVINSTFTSVSPNPLWLLTAIFNENSFGCGKIERYAA